MEENMKKLSNNRIGIMFLLIVVLLGAVDGVVVFIIHMHRRALGIDASVMFIYAQIFYAILSGLAYRILRP